MKWLIIVNLIAFSQAGLLGKTNVLRKVELPLESAIHEPIAPYSFGYTADAVDGHSSREEVSDGSGAVRGSYMISSADGIKRIVNYIADENGFRAQIQTNEPGTENKSPADVSFESSQPPAEEIALKYGPKYEELSKIQTFGSILKESPKPIKLSQVVDHLSITPNLKQKSLIDIPLLKKIDTGLNPAIFAKSLTREFTPALRTPLKSIETPIKLLAKLPTPKVPLASSFYPQELEVQKRDELVQSRESFY